jgi:hypothetical protein
MAAGPALSSTGRFAGMEAYELTVTRLRRFRGDG